MNDQVNKIYTGEKEGSYFKIHAKPQIVKGSKIEKHYEHYGTSLNQVYKILDYFNDESLVFTL